MTETDSLIAVKLINQAEEVMWADGSLVFDILDYASSCASYEFVYVRREANALAHKIAKIDRPYEYGKVIYLLLFRCKFYYE